VVTGASQNIGAALATELAAQGHHLLITARREAVLRELAAALTDRYGVTVDVRAADLSDPDSRATLCDELATLNVSILCANAGTSAFGPVAVLDAQVQRDLLQLNALGVHDLVLAVLPGMVARRAGGILISGSIAGNAPFPNNASYASSKAFVNTFAESLRGEVKDLGINVTLMAAGPVRIDLPAEEKVPDFLFVTSEYVAKLSLNGLARNKMRVVPGLTSKMMSVATGYAPRALVTPITGALYKRLGDG
jgi:uncharacterized protein